MEALLCTLQTPLIRGLSLEGVVVAVVQLAQMHECVELVVAVVAPLALREVLP